MKKQYIWGVLIIAFSFLTCAKIKMPEAGVTMAIARLEPARNSNVQGTVLFYDQGGGLIRIEADVYKLTPGKHGFHIHKQNGKDAML